MERIRVGLTGLAFVLLIVFVAAAGMRPSQSVAPHDASQETLSTLGVAPHVSDGEAAAQDASREEPAERAPARPVEI